MPDNPPTAASVAKRSNQISGRAWEEKRPDAAADVAVAAIEEPWMKISQLARECGMPPAAVDALVDRLRKRYSPAVAEVRKVTGRQMLELLEERLMMALEYLGDAKMAEASARDLAVVIGVLAEKRALLRGEPTQIIGVEERRNLSELLPALLKEAERRGMTVDLNPADYGEVGKPSARVIGAAETA